MGVPTGVVYGSETYAAVGVGGFVVRLLIVPTPPAVCGVGCEIREHRSHVVTVFHVKLGSLEEIRMIHGSESLAFERIKSSIARSLLSTQSPVRWIRPMEPSGSRLTADGR